MKRRLKKSSSGGEHGQRDRSKTEGNFEMLIWRDYNAEVRMEAGIGAIRRAPTAGSDRSSRGDLQPFLCLRQNGPVLGLMAWHVEHGPGSSSLDSLARNFCL